MGVKPIRFNEWSMSRIRSDSKTETRRLPKGDRPRYEVGDVLWVREAWAKVPATACRQSADVDRTESEDGVWWAVFQCGWTYDIPQKWIPNLYMPKWACREWLEVTDVRRERLWEINQDGARREGAQSLPHRCDGYSGPDEPWCRKEDRSGIFDCKKCGYRQIWNDIYGPINNRMSPEQKSKRWEANPEVEVICFNRVPKPEGWPNA